MKMQKLKNIINSKQIVKYTHNRKSKPKAFRKYSGQSPDLISVENLCQDLTFDLELFYPKEMSKRFQTFSESVVEVFQISVTYCYVPFIQIHYNMEKSKHNFSCWQTVSAESDIYYTFNYRPAFLISNNHNNK
ncbi:hypothetical protein AMECASPLE_038176 [Ameca splendens]|uniref:Uncharacterized protein n=1 Tax=Ameca splendens TaxID=208324 RepID=A0ABV1AEI2_9TELE